MDGHVFGARPGTGAAAEGSTWFEVRIALTLLAAVVGLAVASDLLGRSVSFALILLGAAVYAAYRWRYRLTGDALVRLAMYGVPASVLSLWWT